MKIRLLTLALVAALFALPVTGPAAAADSYVIDTKGSHAFVQFRIQHLGYSWLYGRFNSFGGTFTADDDNPGNSKISVEIDTASVDSNHAERDKHLRGSDFLDVGKYPKATFVSTAVKKTGEGTGVVTGDLTLHGVTKSIDIEVKEVGRGKDPWGGYRLGLQGSTTFALKDFGITRNLGPASTHVEMILSIEGIRQ